MDHITLKNGKGVVAKITNDGALLTELDVPTATATGDVVLATHLEGYLDRSQPLLRRDRRPVRQPDRQGQVHPRRQGVHARRQQRRQPPARRHQGLRQGGLEGRGRSDRARRAGGHASPTPAPTARRAIPATSTRRVTYTLTDDNELQIDYTATTDKPTAGQPDEPQLLQPRRRRRSRDDPRPRAACSTPTATRRSTTP